VTPCAVCDADSRGWCSPDGLPECPRCAGLRITAERRREQAARAWAKRLDCRLQRRKGTYRLLDERIEGTLLVETTDLRVVLRRLALITLDERLRAG